MFSKTLNCIIKIYPIINMVLMIYIVIQSTIFMKGFCELNHP